MANKNLFSSLIGMLLPKADAVNEAGGKAYAFSDEHALAQYAVTGCLYNTFYVNAETQAAEVIRLANKVSPEFLAKLAVFARRRGFMKDMPALLLAILSMRDKVLFDKIFSKVIDNGKMLRTFVQIMRSGVVGRKSLGSLPKRKIREWFDEREGEVIFKQSVGQSPSFADIIKMIHPKPGNKEQNALFGYFLGREYAFNELPGIVQRFEAYKNGDGGIVPDIPFQMLTALPLGKAEWSQIAKNAPWQMTRMNLNTFSRHGVLDDENVVSIIAKRLRNRSLVKRSKVFPFQLLSAFITASVPHLISEALQDAMEIAIENVPKIDGKIFILPDVSGSMHSPVTGYRSGSTSSVRCIDVAGLISAAFLRKNPNAEVIPFSDSFIDVKLNSRDSVMTNSQKLANLPSGGTNCSAPLRELNRREAKGDLVVYVSDNQSWIDSRGVGYFGNSPTETMKQWNIFKMRNPSAKLVCIDIQPNATTQAQESAEILNIGGFSDQVFSLIAAFADADASNGLLVKEIENEDI